MRYAIGLVLLGTASAWWYVAHMRPIWRQLQALTHLNAEQEAQLRSEQRELVTLREMCEQWHEPATQEHMIRQQLLLARPDELIYIFE